MLCLQMFSASPSWSQGAGDALECKAQSYFEFSFPQDSLDNCTIELWVNPSQSLDKTYLFYVGEDDLSGFGLSATTLAGVPEEFGVIQLGGVIVAATGNYARLPLNMWTHLAMIRSGNIWKLYKNGSLVGKGKHSPIINSGKVIIGKGFNGMIDEIRFWKRELSQDEIRYSMYQTLHGNESDLRLYYVMDSQFRKGDSVLVNKANNSSPADNAHLVMQGIRPSFHSSSINLYSTPAPSFTLSIFPSHMQFFPQNKRGFARIEFRGTINENGYDSIVLKEWKDDLVIARRSQSIQYLGSIATFDFVDSIHAERSQYTYTLNAINKNSELFLAESSDLVAGDAFFINGQSNAHPAISWYSNVGPFFRTFGIQNANQNYDEYDPGDTSWGYANAHGFSEFFGGPYLVGVWAQRMQEHILSNYGIPTCIINAATGGSTIEQHLPNDTSRLSLTSIYGKALYRSLKSGLQNKYKAIFWYQGEYNSIVNYYNNFRGLYKDWFQDFGDSNDNSILKKIYLFQIRPGCIPGERRALRELQRTISDSLPHIEVMSTCGVSGYEGCHFDAFGYWHIADNIFRLVAHDFYESADTIDILPPNIKKASYADSTRDVIVLEFANVKSGLTVTHDTIISKALRQLTDYFYLDSLSGNVRSIRVHGDSLILYLSSSSSAKYISYLPDETYNNDDTDIYEGPWILNTRGVGALSFNNVPIDLNVPDTTYSGITFQKKQAVKLACNPNPVSSIIKISYILPDPRLIQIELFNLLGEMVLSLEKHDKQQPGEYISSYDLSSLIAGEYFIRMTAGSDILTQKIILAK